MILDNYKDFLDKLLQDIEAKGIDVSKYNLDHFGYQCSSDKDYDKLKPDVEKIAKLISENIVGGRRVGIFKLNNPLDYKDRKIEAVELVAPKEDQECPSALEHAEFVIDTDFDSFINKYSGLDWDLTAINQPTFPMVKLRLSDHTQIKFHLQPVLKIVESK
ncbi:MAG: VOC family protein [Candidatus Woesebacteria bacterium]|nr:MAG: VOC family protein [Candidatus Woesebacteria bacterium]